MIITTLLCLFVAIAVAAAQSVLSVYSTSDPSLAADVHNLLGNHSVRVSTFDLSMGTLPTLSQLRAHGSVFVWGNWGVGTAQQDALGNILADYVDGGGSLTVAMWRFVGSTTRIRGRLLSAGMLPVDPVMEVSGSPATLVKVVPDHRLLQNVRSFSGGPNSWRTTGTVAADAVLVAQWSSGEPLAVVTEKFNGTVVVLGLFPPSSTAGYGLWDNTTDGAQLMTNALQYRRVTPPHTSGRAGGTTQHVDADASANVLAVIAVVLALCLLIVIAAGVVLWRLLRRSSTSNVRFSDETSDDSTSSETSAFVASHKTRGGGGAGSGSSDHSLDADKSSSVLSIVPESAFSSED
jgi:hypothetical protein